MYVAYTPRCTDTRVGTQGGARINPRVDVCAGKPASFLCVASQRATQLRDGAFCGWHDTFCARSLPSPPFVQRMYTHIVPYQSASFCLFFVRLSIDFDYYRYSRCVHRSPLFRFFVPPPSGVYKRGGRFFRFVCAVIEIPFPPCFWSTVCSL